MYLDEIPYYRDKIMEQILKNETIINLIRPPELPDMNISEMVYKYIFPYDHIVDKTTDVGAYLCFDIEAPRVINRSFVDLNIYFWVIIHDRRMLESKGLLTDLLSCEIEKVMNGSRDFGLGRVELRSWGRFNPAEKFHGRTLIYRTVDFNRE